MQDNALKDSYLRQHVQTGYGYHEIDTGVGALSAGNRYSET
jgi:hypothetical protein